MWKLNYFKQDSIPVGCVPLACQPYVSVGVRGGGGWVKNEQVWPPDVTSRGRVAYVQRGGVGISGGVGYVWGVGYVRGSGYVQRGYPLPCDLSHDACDVTYPHPNMNRTDRLLWKHYLPSTTVAGGNKIFEDIIQVLSIIDNFINFKALLNFPKIFIDHLTCNWSYFNFVKQDNYRRRV